MNTDYEDGRDNLAKMVAQYSENSLSLNEATTRARLIDILFFDCLKWSKEDVIMEEAHGGEYADYTFMAPRKVLIVEAKREGNYFELPAGHNRLQYSLPSLMRDFPNIKAAIEQTASYCWQRGVPLGCVCNGHQIIAFVANRNDGISPLEGKALVFPSLQFMSDNFLKLWQALSKPGILENRLQNLLVGDSNSGLPAKLSASISKYPGTQDRNIFQADLQIVSELVIEDVAKANDLLPVFLKECYCQSGALSQYSLISKNILQARYSALFEENINKPTTIPAVNQKGISQDLLADSLSRRPILLIGDVGVGKTTFINHLIRVDAASIFGNSIALYIDLGTQATLIEDLNNFIIDEIIRQLRDDHGVDVEERNFVRGVYNLDIQRLEKTVIGDLKEIDPQAFRLEEIKFLAKKVENKAEHVQRSLQHLSKGRKKQIIIFLDNADQRNDNIQQHTFIAAQEFAERWLATVFVALRPETFHRSVKSGSLSGYHVKAFTISPPRIDEVIQKRLLFALKIASGEIALQGFPETTVRFNTLNKIINVFLDSLERDEDLSIFTD